LLDFFVSGLPQLFENELRPDQMVPFDRDAFQRIDPDRIFWRGYHVAAVIGRWPGNRCRSALDRRRGSREIASKRSRFWNIPNSAWKQFFRIEVENFPAFIGIDDKGNDFFKELNLW